MADTISIEEANKIRASLGMKPLPVPGGGGGLAFKESNDSDSSAEKEDQGSTLESRQAEGYENWRKLEVEAEAKAKREAKSAAIKKARDVALRNAKLEGKGLGEADDAGDVDTRTWLIQQKKRQKKIEKARKLEEELAEREQQAIYGSEDLAGLKVGHELNDFSGDGEQVLTLKDTTIDENEEEGDELENLDMREREKLSEKLELKKKKPAYNPNDLSDDKHGILQQYDDEIDGKSRNRFTLDAQGTTAQAPASKAEGVITQAKPKAISLDILNEIPASDYQEPAEVKLRKPKKKKAKSTRKKASDEDDIFPSGENIPSAEQNGDSMEVDSGIAPVAANRKRTLEDTSLVDDDDLQASLARQRREALKKRKKTKPEDIARQMREEASATPMETHGNSPEEEEEEPGLIIDETSEFVANLQKPTVPEPRRSTSRPANGIRSEEDSPAALPPDEEGDVDMERSYNDVQDEEEAEQRLKRETSTPGQQPITSTGIDEETTVSQGMGATLSMLTQRGLVDRADSGNLNALHRERQRFLAEKQRREDEAERRARLQRERDRSSGKLDRMSAREREEYARFENRQRDQAESRQMADIFNKEYKPDVQLRYTDEFGRQMSQKEAFKHLSHQFHGKGSGKQKTEKRLKKIEDEKKRAAASSLDSSEATGMNNAMGATAKKNRQAGVRLA
ncbi:hypothetical protein L228DRAFT_250358 [Xylona heveae TC161]|uniref:SART-1 protein n=1 Tax=Xylona heveae (strain CBS 132557 / TC161) TaxID=1328760 RepID=A0A165A4L2_XYLHT|nr:hypothetical protein L228DRAFT_250358 [Xylona heveae TC161]KZF19940.1 hypothetical protein L228DRAFT_250358 [Xylona heveae TC161]